MTLVATWINNERAASPSIWSIADTKISSVHTTLTDEGSKLLELNVACRQFAGSDYGKTVFRTSLGYAFAGSSLIGLNTYATLSTILGSLGAGLYNRMRPDCYSIIDVAKDVLHIYTQSVHSLAEIVIWGKCPKSQKTFIGTVKGRIDEDQLYYEVDVRDNVTDHLEVVLIGSHVQEIYQMIQEKAVKYEGEKDHSYWRLPINVLSETVNTGRYNDIGGNLQLATYDDFLGFTHYAIIDSDRHDLPLFRNIDIYRRIGGSVGDCIIGMPSMMINEKDFSKPIVTDKRS